MHRREFLSRAVFFTVSVATLSACGGGESGEAAGTYGFPNGVASGDPRDTSVVFWSRCTRGSGDTSDIEVRLEVSTTSDFTVRTTVDLVAAHRYDFTVRAKVTNLLPATRYYYRFVAGTDVSPTGTTRTAPAAASSVAELRFGWISCQDWSVNHWGAMELLAQENLDFLVHLGDYIYETVGAGFQSGRAEGAHPLIKLPDGSRLADGAISASTLADYRTLYRTYRSDPRLQTLHARFPVIATWDDHEFSDDCWQDHQTYTNANTQQTARRRAANQAWVEYMPVDFGDVSFDTANAAYDNLRIYRDFRFGNLLHLIMTDERLYRDDHVVSEALIAQAQGHDPVGGSDSTGARYFVGRDALLRAEAQRTAISGRAPSILGSAQAQWWKDTMKNSTATWRVWGNEVMLSRMWLDLRATAPAPYNQLYVVNADGWDGYPAHRADLLGWLKTHKIGNVVAITGDLHAFQAGVVRDDPDPARGTPVLVDLVGAGISSSSLYSYLLAGAKGTPLAALLSSPAAFDALIKANNPDFAFLDHDAQGYCTATLTPGTMWVTYTKVKPLGSDGTRPKEPLLQRTRLSIAAGSPAVSVLPGS